MPKAFDFTSPPFDRLRPKEVERVDRAVDIVFFREHAVILRPGDLPDHLYVVIKGQVDERDGDEVVTVHESGDAFDAGVLVHKACRHAFVVREEAICYALPIEEFLELVANNTGFAAFFYRELGHKLDALAQRRTAPQAQGSLTVRVGQALIHAAVRIAPTTTLHETALRMDEAGQRALLIEDGGRIGIVTDVDLTRAAIRDRQPLETPVATVAQWDVLGVEEDAFLYEAALDMARHKVRHLAVRREGAIVGIVDAATVLRSLANQADAVGSAIERATTLDQLAEASDAVSRLIRQLHETGTKLHYLTELSSDLHRKLTSRTLDLLAPPGLVEHAALIVMGSEGRGEYLLKTDQDNGLILVDGYAPADLDAFRNRFTEALIEIGFPACPGEIMVRNPAWSQPLSGWKERVRRWILEPSEDALMNLAIFYDATCVAGRADLLDEAKSAMFDILAGNQAFYARFARAIDLFETPIGVFGRVITVKGDQGQRLDLKKGGIFPLMHGVRALALEKGLRETNTLHRLRRLQEAGVVDKAQAQELGDAFQFLSGLRLTARLEKMRLHQPLDNFVNPAEITKLERDLLKDSLLIVKSFKERIRHHFRLAMFG